MQLRSVIKWYLLLIWSARLALIFPTHLLPCRAQEVFEAESVSNAICTTEEEPSTVNQKPKIYLLRQIRRIWGDLWLKHVPKLPGMRTRPQLAEFPAHESRRVARSGSALEVRSATCLKKYPTQEDVAVEEELEEPHKGMVLHVFQHDACSSADVQYELVEPLHLELGISLKHVADFAYIPVITTGTGPVILDENDKVVIESDPAAWWKWWVPRWVKEGDHSSQYKMNDEAFAGGSHGEVWRGKRRCTRARRRDSTCQTALIFKRLKVERGYRILEAGLREIYFGSWLAQQRESQAGMFTRYVDHFFRDRPGETELWIVFRDAGPSLRSYLYTGLLVGNYMVYQHSSLWTQIRRSLSNVNKAEGYKSEMVKRGGHDDRNEQKRSDEAGKKQEPTEVADIGRKLMSAVLGQILEAAAFLHKNGVTHRDIKPSNIMCKANLDWQSLRQIDADLPLVECVLGDFSSAWNRFTESHLYTRGPSRAEQSDEYSPPEFLIDNSNEAYKNSSAALGPAFDSWSIGIVALELLLGTPNVFSVDQRTKVILTHKMESAGATEEEIQRALYLAALSQFCIYNPSLETKDNWPIRDDLLHRSAMVKESCTIHDFHRALRARDPLGLGFDSSADTLLHLLWQLLAWDPSKRITAAEALRHPYFTRVEEFNSGQNKALESQMLDPRMDFNLSDTLHEFTCPRCGRVFDDLGSCNQHAIARKHAKFCTYDTTSLPTCLNAHSLLPVHYSSGYCDIQGRRKVVEDFHSIYLLPTRQFYGLFDGHTGNLASKYAASTLYQEMNRRLESMDEFVLENPDWKHDIEQKAIQAFTETHEKFLKAISLVPYGAVDESGTTATIMLVTTEAVVIASLGDSRAVMSSKKERDSDLKAIQLTKDHTAADPEERALVESRGGHVISVNGIDRVNGSLVITRSIGDVSLASALSQIPQVISMSKTEMKEMCGELGDKNSLLPCFVILASDGLWDVVSNQEAVDIVAGVISRETQDKRDWRQTSALQEAAESLVHEAYVRRSTDNIGVCVVAIE